LTCLLAPKFTKERPSPRSSSGRRKGEKKRVEPALISNCLRRRGLLLGKKGKGCCTAPLIPARMVKEGERTKCCAPTTAAVIHPLAATAKSIGGEKKKKGTQCGKPFCRRQPRMRKNQTSSAALSLIAAMPEPEGAREKAIRSPSARDPLGKKGGKRGGKATLHGVPLSKSSSFRRDAS